MITDQHQIPGLKIRIHPAGSIGQEQCLCPHQLHQPHRQHHITDGIALIIMHPSLHADYRHLVHIPENKSAVMPRHSGNGKLPNLTVRDLRLHLDGVRIIAQPGTQHQRHFRTKICVFSYAFQAAH